MPSSTNKANKLLVFLSYAREDETVVRRLYNRLEREGFDPWMDQERILPGQDWDYEIKQAMSRCDAILLCFSEKSLSKVGYIQREYKEALELQKNRPPGTIYVIPVRLDTCPIPEFLKSLQCVDYPKGARKLIQALHQAETKLGANTHGSAKSYVTVEGGAGEDIAILGGGDMAVEVIIRIFPLSDLNRLVRDSFQKPGELQAILANTFPAGAAGPGAQGFTAEFIRNHEISRLMSEIKKRNPAGYRDFLAARVLAAVGLASREIPPVETDAKIIDADLLDLQKAAIARQRADLNDLLEFEDRGKWFDQIRFGKESHVVLYGPSGVGKSHFLRTLPQHFKQDACCVLIDLSRCKQPKDILPLAIEQLGGDPKAADAYQEFAKRINARHDETPRIRRFYFLFDNADHNQPAIDYLFSPENLIGNPELQPYLETWDLTGKVQLKIIIAAHHPLRPSSGIYPAFSSAVQIKIDPLDSFSVENMLEKIVIQRNIPVAIGRIADLSDKVYYLTGGHPKCTKQMLLALAERGCVVATEETWIKLYKEHVIATIHAEMLQPVDPKLLSTIWNLSIFRRFDQRLLGGLLDRGILPSEAGDKSRQARELRTRLVGTNLFEAEEETSTTSTNYVMRHALSLNLQLDAPGRYKALHAVALQMYLDRFLGSEAGPDKRIERLALNLLELLYHWTKLLEVEPQKKGTRAKAQPPGKRIRDAFEDYLLLAMSMMGEEEQPEFFKTVKTRWEADKELREAIRRITPQEDCLAELQGVFQKYEPIRDGMD
jgi:hypothetical protein